MLSILFYIVFVLAAIVLIVVVLLQEGRGGGFGEALGSHGRETFGAGNRGINTFTAVVASIFLVSALFIHVLGRLEQGRSVTDLGGGPSLDSVPGLPASPGDSSGGSGGQ